MEEVLVHPFPQIRIGGLFLMIVGAFLCIGWTMPRIWWVFLAAGFAVAGTAIPFSGGVIPPFGSPVPMQQWAVGGAIALEAVLIPIAVWLNRHDERRIVLWIFLLVGFHFLPMAIAFGPVMAMAGIAMMANAAAGFAIVRLPLPLVGFVDGLIKLGFGYVLLFIHPDWPLPGLPA